MVHRTMHVIFVNKILFYLDLFIHFSVSIGIWPQGMYLLVKILCAKYQTSDWLETSWIWKSTNGNLMLVLSFPCHAIFMRVRRNVHSTHQFLGEITNQITNFFSFKSFSCDFGDLKRLLQLNYTAYFGELKKKKKTVVLKLVIWSVTSPKNNE